MKTREQILSDKTSPRNKVLSVNLGVEPLRWAYKPISGHAVIVSNYTGNSSRVANTWGVDWADKGTAYFMVKENTPTEAWIVYYNQITKGLYKQIKKSEKQKEKQRKKLRK